MAQYYDEEMKKNANKYFAYLPEDARMQLVDDLDAVGVTEKFFSNVHVAPNTSTLSMWIKNYFSLGQNVLIFGDSGAGKTQIIEQSAAALGYNVILDTVAVRLPEDYGGYPMALAIDLPDDLYASVTKRSLYDKKLAEAVDAEYQKRSATTKFYNPALAKRQIKAELADTITVTDDEITAEVSKVEKANRPQRLVQQIAAPDWVYQVIDDWVVRNKRTVIFFDEINQGTEQTMNSLFNLVQKGQYGNKLEYSFKDAVVFAGAGNFPRENRSVNALSVPLLDRFRNIFVLYADWSGSIAWVKQSYLEFNDKYPNLAKLLADSSVTDDAWQNAFSTPRTMEQAVEIFAKLEELSKTNPAALADFVDLDSIGLVDRKDSTLVRAVKRFLAAIGVPAFVAEASSGPSGQGSAELTKRHNLAFSKAWAAYMEGRRVNNIPNDTKSYSTSNITIPEFYRVLKKAYPRITREGLDSANYIGGTKSALTLLLEAGVPEADLPR